MKAKVIKKNFNETGNQILGSLNNHFINFDKFNKNKSDLSKKSGFSKEALTDFIYNVSRFSSVQLGELYDFYDEQLILYMFKLDVVPKWLDSKESNDVSNDKFKLQLSEYLYSLDDSRLEKHLEVLNITQYNKEARKIASLNEIKTILKSYILSDDDIETLAKLVWAMEPNYKDNVLYFGEYALAEKDVKLEGYSVVNKYNIQILHQSLAEEIDFNNILLPNGEKGDTLCQKNK